MTSKITTMKREREGRWKGGLKEELIGDVTLVEAMVHLPSLLKWHI